MLLSQYLQYLSNLDINLFLKVYNYPVFNITMKLETIDSNTVTIYKTNDNILYSDAQLDVFIKRIYVYYAIPLNFDIRLLYDLQDIIASELIRDKYIYKGIYIQNNFQIIELEARLDAVSRSFTGNH